MSNRQTGFTLIELITVIVILGILAATAAPRFINLSGDARAANLGAVASSMQSATGMAYGSWLASGSSATSVSIVGGGTATITSASGLLTANSAGVCAALNLGSTYACSNAGLVTLVPAVAGCQVQYVAVLNTAPTITRSGC